MTNNIITRLALLEDIIDMISLEEDIDQAAYEAIPEKFFELMKSFNMETNSLYSRSIFSKNLNLFRRRNTNIFIEIVSKTTIFFLAQSIAKLQHLSLKKHGVNDYKLNNSALLNSFIKQDKEKEKTGQSKHHKYTSAIEGCPAIQLTTQEFEKLLNYYDLKRLASKTPPQLIAKTFVAVLNKHLIINDKNKEIVRKSLVLILNDMFKECSWGTGKAHEYAKTAIESILKINASTKLPENILGPVTTVTKNTP